MILNTMSQGTDMNLHKDEKLRSLFDNLQSSLISSVSSSEKISINGARPWHIDVSRHSHGPCHYIHPTCSFCMLHGNIFATTNVDNDKESIVNEFLLQN